MRLAELQAAFAGGLRTGVMPPALVGLVGPGAAPPPRLLYLHRNHVRTTLGAALALHFPVVRRLVGAEAFTVIANRFIAAHPPVDPVMALYGAGLPGFLAGEAALASHGVVAAVAGFEWARHRASILPGGRTLIPADLQALSPDLLDDLRLGLHPTASLLDSDVDVERVWLANQPGCDGGMDGSVHRACRLVVWRDAGDAIRAAPLSPADLAFLSALAAGQPLGRAVAAALEADSGAVAGNILAAALGRGLLTFDQEEEKP